MIEQLSLLLATPIAKVILDKFYEGVGSELAKKAINELPKAVQDKIQKLGQFVWNQCLRQKADQTQPLLQQAADGSEVAQATLTKALHQVLDKNPGFAQEVHQLADEIQQIIQMKDCDAENVLNVFAGGTGQQFNNKEIHPHASVQQGTINNTHHHHYDSKPD